MTNDDYVSIGNRERSRFIGKILTYLRKRAGRTRKQVSIKTGINLYNYTNYETGQCAPPIESLIILALYYNVTIDFITGMSFLIHFHNMGKELQDTLNNLTTDQLIENSERLVTLFENICYMAAASKEGIKICAERPDLEALATEQLKKLANLPS